MKQCPYCGKRYPDDALVCAIDETALETDQPAPPPVSTASPPAETAPAAEPVPVEEASDVPEGYRTLTQLEPLEAKRLLQKLEKAGIEFLIDRGEKWVNGNRSVIKRTYIDIYVPLDSYDRAMEIFSADWQV